LCGLPTTEIVPPASPRSSFVQTFLGFGLETFAGAAVGADAAVVDGSEACVRDDTAGFCAEFAARSAPTQTRRVAVMVSARIMMTPRQTTRCGRFLADA